MNPIINIFLTLSSAILWMFSKLPLIVNIILIFSCLSLFYIFISKTKQYHKENYIHPVSQKDIIYNNESKTSNILSQNIQKHTEILPHKLYATLSSTIVNQFKFEPSIINNYIDDFLQTNRNESSISYLKLLFYLFTNCSGLSQQNRLDLGSYLVWKVDVNSQIEYIYNQISKIALNKSNSNVIRGNAIDILLHSNNAKYTQNANMLLNELRRHENRNNSKNVVSKIQNKINTIEQEALNEHDPEIQQILFNQLDRLQNRQQNVINDEKRLISIYQDSQSVHNHTINETVLSIASNLVNDNIKKSHYDYESDLQKYYTKYNEHQNKIQKSIERIQSDTTKFRNEITLSSIFASILNYISHSEYRKDLIIRLGEELTEMSGLCATGHLSRLLNVVQGVPDIPDNLKIKMDIKDEIYASLQAYLNISLQETSNYDELMNSMIEQDFDNRRMYLNFIKKKMIPKIQEYQKEYDGLVDLSTLKSYINIALTNYCMNETDVQYILNQ